jgi:hypothetical protein
MKAFLSLIFIAIAVVLLWTWRPSKADFCAPSGCAQRGVPIAISDSDDPNIDITQVQEIHVVGDDAGIFTEDTGGVFKIDVGAKWPVASEADALSADPNGCQAGQWATDSDEAGHLTCSTPSGGGDLNLDPNTHADNRVLVTDGVDTKVAKASVVSLDPNTGDVSGIDDLSMTGNLTVTGTISKVPHATDGGLMSIPQGADDGSGAYGLKVPDAGWAADPNTAKVCTLSTAGAIGTTGNCVEVDGSTSLPGSCNPRELYIDTDADTNGELYFCDPNGNWKAVFLGR